MSAQKKARDFHFQASRPVAASVVSAGFDQDRDYDRGRSTAQRREHTRDIRDAGWHCHAPEHEHGYGDPVNRARLKRSDPLLRTATALPLGQAVDASLAPDGAVLYALTATQGQVFQFDVNTSTASAASWTLFDNNFQPIGLGDLNLADNTANFQATIPADGTYLLVLSSNEPTADQVSFQVTQVADTPVASSGFAGVHSGTFAQGQQPVTLEIGDPIR